MFLIDKVILLAGALMVLAAISSKFSARLGVPVLVLFLGVGMLAGSEGPGRISFDDYELAHAIGSVALAVILFDGGLQTPIASLKAVWKPAGLLATVGVLITAVITGVAAHYVLGLSWLEGLLLGSIVGSTDAAAVFSLLRSAGVSLKPRLGALLETESASNDPMAIFLTVGLLEVLLGKVEPGFGLVTLFVMQMGVGGAVGYLGGRLAARVVNRLQLEAPGLYPVLTIACGMLVFGVAANLGGSGFLAIYVAGIVLGNQRIVFQRGTFLFNDALAWGSQMTMFVVLGLLSTPSELLAVGLGGVALAAVLILVARPIAVAPLLFPFGYSLRETVLVSWVGLKGAVPIILATYPLMYGTESARVVFNAVFFIVLVSAIVQGSTLPAVARWLRLEEPRPPPAPATLEIVSLKKVGAEIVDVAVTPASRAAGRRVSELGLPEGSVVAMIARGDEVIPPRGSTTVLAGDHVFLVLTKGSREAADEAFAPLAPAAPPAPAPSGPPEGPAGEPKGEAREDVAAT